MRIIEFPRRTETLWEPGDLVRLSREEIHTKRSRGFEGEWGEVAAIEGQLVRVNLQGYSRPSDGPWSQAKMLRGDLVQWQREPRDEPAIRANVVRALADLSWMGDPRMEPGERGHCVVRGWGIGNRHPRYYDARTAVTPVVLADLLPLLGSGQGSVTELDQVQWSVNEAGHRLLDAHGHPLDQEIGGGGASFDYFYARRGHVTVRDLGTGLAHVFEGDAAQHLLRASRGPTGYAIDAMVRPMLPYPRTLRRHPDTKLAVIEMDEERVQLRVDRQGTVHAGDAAMRIRRAIGHGQVVHLEQWLRKHFGVHIPPRQVRGSVKGRRRGRGTPPTR